MTIRRIMLTAASLCALGVLPALAQDGPLQPQMQGSVPYVSGGIGEGGQRAIREVEGDYNLKLLFAQQGSGEYLADIGVRIVDAKGAMVLDATAEGPFMLVRLPAGSYKVVAVNEGVSQTKPVTVSAKGTASLSFYWPGK